MDRTDRQIVALLREDARRSFQDVGRRVSLSAPAVKRRVDRLEAEGVIRGYAALVDPRRFGAADVEAAVRSHPEVVAAYTVAGQASAILIVRAEDTEHLERVLERLRESRGITRTRTAVVLS